MFFGLTEFNGNLPEGTYTFTVNAVDDNAEYNKCSVRLLTSDGRTQTLFFTTTNNGSLAALSQLYYGATGGGVPGEQANTLDMVGGRFRARVIHKQANNGSVFVNLRDVEPLDEAPASINAADVDGLLDELGV